MVGIALSPVIPDLARGSEIGAGAMRLGTRTLTVDRRFLLFPINNDSMSRRVRLVKDGRILRSFTAALGLPAQWWAHLDVTEWEGKTLTVTVEKDTSRRVGYLPPPGRGLDETDNAILAAAVKSSATIWSPDTLYKERFRPLFHFSAARGWLNDPNGLMYHDGQYHLFFQHNPYGVRWSNMHWAHAVSTDLVHWQELPIALYPRGEDDFPYSGAGAVDLANTSGWAKNGRPPMVVAFYSTGRGECIAHSADNGRTWKEFERNPVVRAERDAKLLWHAPTKRWVMPVYSERLNGKPVDRRDGDPLLPGTQRGIAFYTSSDLKSWQERSWIEGFIDCPDLFALPVDGNSDRVKWVLTCGPGHYQIGEFDGSRFVPESPRLPGPPSHPAYYSGQVFNNHPDGDVVQIACVKPESPGQPFRGLMTFPVTLSLQTTVDGVRLCRKPVDSISSLYLHNYECPSGQLTGSPLLTELAGGAWDIELTIKVSTIAPISLSLGNDEYTYHPPSQMFSGPNGDLPIPLSDERVRMRILVDRTTIEVFGDRGQAYAIFARNKAGQNAPLKLQAWEGHLETLRAHALRSAWITSAIGIRDS
jgi:fructan beta-fructosidase